MPRPLSIIALVALLTSGCATGIDPAKYNPAPAARDRFMLCHGYGCTSRSAAGFDAGEWARIGAIFDPPARSAPGERERISRAIAAMEKIAGDKTGTSEDLAMAGSIKESPLQLDCIDETVNTMHYLDFLNEAGFLRFHEPAEPTHRGYFIDGRWPHNTAVVRETESGALYVVDSFYRANGQEPYILPREDWLAGWKPPGATQ